MPCLKNNSKFSVEEIMVFRFRAYFVPSFVTFGVIGNIIVMIIFYRMQCRQTSRFNIYVMWIAFFQTIDLITNGLLDDFIGRGLTWASDCTISIKLDTINSFLCKFFNYVPKVADLIANTLLVIFSLDRLLTIYQPIRFRGDQYNKLPIILIVITIFISIMLFLPQLIYSDLINQDHSSTIVKTTCQYVNSLNFGVQYVLYLSIVGIYIVPTVLIALLNTFIVLRLRSLTKDRKQLCNQTNSTSNEIRRIIGHLLVTSIFLLFTLPLVVVIILRQESDFLNYSKIYPLYAQRLVHLSRLFSSFDAITYSSEFPIFLAFLPNFRQILLRSLCMLPFIRNLKCAQNYLVKTINLSDKSNRIKPQVRVFNAMTTNILESIIMSKTNSNSVNRDNSLSTCQKRRTQSIRN